MFGKALHCSETLGRGAWKDARAVAVRRKTTIFSVGEIGKTLLLISRGAWQHSASRSGLRKILGRCGWKSSRTVAMLGNILQVSRYA